MQIDISCDQYARFAAIPQTLKTDREQQLGYTRCVYIERRKGHAYLVATNVRTAAIEYLGASDGPDECAAIIADEPLRQQCIVEIPFNGKLSITANPMLGFTTLKTSMGYEHKGSGAVVLPETNYFQEWRKWLPDEMPKASKGAMHWNVEDMEALARASPTGFVCFPSFIDVAKPVLITDENAPEWIGLFIASKRDEPAVPSQIPGWVGL